MALDYDKLLRVSLREVKVAAVRITDRSYLLGFFFIYLMQSLYKIRCRFR